MIDANLLYKEDLDNLNCECGCPSRENHVFFHSKCHRGYTTWVYYFDGTLTINCSACDQVIARIAVANKKKGGDNSQ